MFQFQWIEVSLKIAISISQALIKERVNGALEYRPGKEKLDKYTLGRLVEVYERLGGDLALGQELRGHIKVRNALAHEAFILNEKEQRDEVFLGRRIAELQALYDKLGGVVKALHDRITALDAMLNKAPNSEAD